MEDLNNFVPSLLHPRSERKTNFSGLLNSNKKKTLALRKHPDCSTLELEDPNGKCISTRKPLQDLTQTTNANLKCGENFKHIKAICSLNVYHQKLLDSIENPTASKMSSKKKNTSKLKNATPKRNVKPQNSILNYFGSKTQKRDLLDPIFKSKIEEICLRNKVFAQPLDSMLPIYDLCDSSNSDQEHTSGHNVENLQKEVQSNPWPQKVEPVTLSFNKNYLNITNNSTPASKNIKHSNQYSYNKNTLDKKLSSVFSSPKHNRKKTFPSYKVVKDTPFAVDAFSYGEIPGVSTYFLTHFHSDHYMGLNKSFKQPIYCTKITGDLCQQKLYVKYNIINILEVGSTIELSGIHVTTVDANHCPGSVMLIFSLPCGKNILHCGDFRASPAMESYPIFWDKEIHTVYLDTTYCNPRYNFPTQNESIEQALTILQTKRQKMTENGIPFSQLLICCGTYTIGKENFFVRIANELKISVYASSEKSRILKIALGENFCVNSAQSCQLHVLPMGKLNYQFLESYLNSIKNYSEVIAFKPSGWELSKGSLIQRGNVTIHGIPYSEHSSFSELQRFTKFLKPKVIIPTVPGNGGPEAMQKYFSCWVGDGDQEKQRKVSDFFKVDKTIS